MSSVRLPVRARLIGVLLVPVVGWSCGHSEPFATAPPDPLGPFTATVPRQLTYNPGDDRSPAVSGTSVSYSRTVRETPFEAPCLAILPAEGGTLRAEYCPPPPSVVDTFVNNWLEPTLSPDGSRIAFVWRRSARVSALAAWSHDLVVAEAATPGTPLLRVPLPITLPDGRIANTALELRWTDATTLRYLATYEYIYKVKGGGATRLTDTTYLPYALMELSTADGTPRMVPGGDSVVAYADDGRGGTWIARGDSAQSTLVYLAPDGSRTPAPALPFPASDLDFAGGRLVAAGGQLTVAYGDPAVGSWRFVGARGPVFRIALLDARALVAEVELATSDFGLPANLWLIPIPD